MNSKHSSPLKHILVVLFLSIPVFGISQEISDTNKMELNFHHCYYPESSFTLGIGATYSIKLNAVGVNARVYYNIDENWCVGPEFSYVNNGESMLYDMSLIAHYIIETSLVGIYPVIGLNYSLEGGNHESIGAFGVVFGGGVHRNFNKLTVFTEYTHIQSKLQDDFVSLGLMLNLRK